MIRKIAILLPVILLTGCTNSSPELSAIAQKVEVMKYVPENRKCKYLGDIAGDGVARNVVTAQKDARIAFRNNAGDMGANVAVLDSIIGGESKDCTARSRISVNGSAYSCSKNS